MSLVKRESEKKMTRNHDVEDFLKMIIKNLDTHTIKIKDIYNIEYTKRWELPKRQTKGYRLIFFRQGSGSVYFPDAKVPIEPGRLLLYSPNLQHHSVQEEIIPSVISINFEIRNNSQGNLCVPRVPFQVSLMSSDIHFFHTAFEKLAKEFMKKGDDIQEIFHDVTMKQLITQIYREVADLSNIKPCDSRIEGVKTVIKKNITSLPNLEELCEVSGLSKNYFSRLFKEEVGMSPKHYIYRIKMEHAKYLLSQLNYSVKETALTLGYSDPYIFSNQFKRVYGFPPSKLKRYKKNN